MSRIILKLLNNIYGWVVGAVVMAAVAYAGYSIWDNFQIYQAAEDVQNEIRQLKPDKEAKGGPGFDDLRKLNGEVVGWITVDGTNIDYPILQGENNLDYMNKDVYGNFSLAGSIFLDTRNQRDFSDDYALIYGHNMDEHLMFGDLALFKEKDFFENNQTASLLVPGEKRDLKVAAVLQIPAGTEDIFNPDKWKNNLNGLGEFIKDSSIWYHTDLIQGLISHASQMEVVSLVTCSDGSTNDRTVLILIRQKDASQTTGTDSSQVNGTGSSNTGRTDAIGGNGPKKTGDGSHQHFWEAVIVGILLFIVVFESIDRYRSRRKKAS